MLNSTSFRLRFAFSFGANIVRALLGFFTGLFVARGLSPAGYGDLMFLVGSFVAIRSLLDLGTSSAFFTFISQRPKGQRFYLLYFGWMATQFILTLGLVLITIPMGAFDRIWLQHELPVVLLALGAAFLQQQVWAMVGQIGESMRKTVKVQLLNLAVAVFYLAMVLLMQQQAALSVPRVLMLVVAQYVLAVAVAIWILKNNDEKRIEEVTSLREVLTDFTKYCKPLALLALVSFSYDFADKWLLQRFGGSVEQGYFQIASQFAAVSLLATSSILAVFWKEIANAWADQDYERAGRLYQRATRGLVTLGAILTGLLVPWAEQIVRFTLGEAYLLAWPVLAIMFLYPIHQSLGQIGGTMLLATGKTSKYTAVGIGMMLFSIPVSYFVLAPTASSGFGGLGMGAEGLAWKMVLLGVCSANLQAWVVARTNGWVFDWLYQVVGISTMLCLGLAAKWLSCWIFGTDGFLSIESAYSFLFGGVIYLILVTGVLIAMPWLAGLENKGMKKLLQSLKERRSWT